VHEKIQVILGALVAVIFGLSALSRRFPTVAWLQHFRIERPQLSEERRARMRRQANVRVGIELILFGFAIPPGYLVLEMMLFSDITKLELALVLASSVLCIGLGITAIVHSIRR
jgi:hypothetical protein